MRLLANFADEDQATRFGDYLLTLKIDNSVEEESSGWAVWVKDDDKLEPARRELDQFNANPNDHKYSAAARDAERVRNDLAKRAERRAKNFVDVRTQWARAGGHFKAVTLAVIAMSCLVYVVMVAGGERVSVNGLLISPRVPPDIMPAVKITGGSYFMWWPLSNLIEIKHGQVWRLITPIFVHGGILHLLFNMSMLRDFGFIIEERKGSLKLVLFILLIAIPSNLAQYMMEGPWFGGMSGVVYGLFGYIWMKGKFAPHEGMNLHPHTIFVCIAWFVLCFTPLIGNIANTAHAVGLLTGMSFALAPYLRRKIFR
jgi:GlpG protein